MFERPELPGKRCIAFRKTGRNKKPTKITKRSKYPTLEWKSCIIRCVNTSSKEEQGKTKICVEWEENESREWLEEENFHCIFIEKTVVACKHHKFVKNLHLAWSYFAFKDELEVENNGKTIVEFLTDYQKCFVDPDGIHTIDTVADYQKHVVGKSKNTKKELENWLLLQNTQNILIREVFQLAGTRVKFYRKYEFPTHPEWITAVVVEKDLSTGYLIVLTDVVLQRLSIDLNEIQVQFLEKSAVEQIHEAASQPALKQGQDLFVRNTRNRSKSLQNAPVLKGKYSKLNSSATKPKVKSNEVDSVPKPPITNVCASRQSARLASVATAPVRSLYNRRNFTILPATSTATPTVGSKRKLVTTSVENGQIKTRLMRSDSKSSDIKTVKKTEVLKTPSKSKIKSMLVFHPSLSSSPKSPVPHKSGKSNINDEVIRPANMSGNSSAVDTESESEPPHKVDAKLYANPPVISEEIISFVEELLNSVEFMLQEDEEYDEEDLLTISETDQLKSEEIDELVESDFKTALVSKIKVEKNDLKNIFEAEEITSKSDKHFKDQERTKSYETTPATNENDKSTNNFPQTLNAKSDEDELYSISAHDESDSISFHNLENNSQQNMTISDQIHDKIIDEDVEIEQPLIGVKSLSISFSSESTDDESMPVFPAEINIPCDDEISFNHTKIQSRQDLEEEIMDYEEILTIPCDEEAGKSPQNNYVPASSEAQFSNECIESDNHKFDDIATISEVNETKNIESNDYSTELNDQALQDDFNISIFEHDSDLLGLKTLNNETTSVTNISSVECPYKYENVSMETEKVKQHEIPPNIETGKVENESMNNNDLNEKIELVSENLTKNIDTPNDQDDDCNVKTADNVTEELETSTQIDMHMFAKNEHKMDIPVTAEVHAEFIDQESCETEAEPDAPVTYEINTNNSNIFEENSAGTISDVETEVSVPFENGADIVRGNDEIVEQTLESTEIYEIVPTTMNDNKVHVQSAELGPSNDTDCVKSSNDDAAIDEDSIIEISAESSKPQNLPISLQEISTKSWKQDVNSDSMEIVTSTTTLIQNQADAVVSQESESVTEADSHLDSDLNPKPISTFVAPPNVSNKVGTASNIAIIDDRTSSENITLYSVANSSTVIHAEQTTPSNKSTINTPSAEFVEMSSVETDDLSCKETLESIQWDNMDADDSFGGGVHEVGNIVTQNTMENTGLQTTDAPICMNLFDSHTEQVVCPEASILFHNTDNKITMRHAMIVEKSFIDIATKEENISAVSAIEIPINMKQNDTHYQSPVEVNNSSQNESKITATCKDTENDSNHYDTSDNVAQIDVTADINKVIMNNQKCTTIMNDQHMYSETTQPCKATSLDEKEKKEQTFNLDQPTMTAGILPKDISNDEKPIQTMNISDFVPTSSSSSQSKEPTTPIKQISPHVEKPQQVIKSKTMAELLAPVNPKAPLSEVEQAQRRLLILKYLHRRNTQLQRNKQIEAKKIREIQEKNQNLHKLKKAEIVPQSISSAHKKFVPVKKKEPKKRKISKDFTNFVKPKRPNISNISPSVEKKNDENIIPGQTKSLRFLQNHSQKVFNQDTKKEKNKKSDDNAASSILNKPKIRTELKKNESSFVQDASCQHILGTRGVHTRMPKFKFKCLECRKSKGKKNTHIFCRFYGIRKLRFHNNSLVHSGFLDPEKDCNTNDLRLWLPSPQHAAPKKHQTNWCSLTEPLAKSTCSYILKYTSGQFCQLVKQELEAFSWIAPNEKICWKRPVVGVREMCDCCETTLFNLHWMCPVCGFGVCLDCFKKRRNKCEDELCVYDLVETGLHRWEKCTKNKFHFPSGLMPVQIIPSNCLKDMFELFHQWQTYCGCKHLKLQQKQISAQKPVVFQKKFQPNHTVFNFDNDSNEGSNKAEYEHVYNNALLRFIKPGGSNSTAVFQCKWGRGQCVMVSGVQEHLNMRLWHPDKISDQYGHEMAKNALVNCANGAIVANMKIRDFWEGFEDISRRLIDDEQKSMILKLKDWPTTEDFEVVMPNRFRDLMQALPMADYSHRTGLLNLASRLPSFFAKPDLGPKMYNGYGWATETNWMMGTTNLHLDISDAVNVMVYVGIPHDQPHSAIENLQKIIEEGDVDTTQAERTNTDKPGALWHIFRPEDTDKIRKLIKQVSKEQGEEIPDDHDPVHDQTLYLTRPLRRRLYEEYGVQGVPILQYEGDSIFIPAGAAHQVFNLHSCIKVAEDFVSPEHVSKCFKLTNEFRYLSSTHLNHEDKLQIKNVIYHSTKDIISSLQWHKQQEDDD